MGWSGGTFSRTDGVVSGSTTWQDNRDAGTKIRADRHDTHDQDLADGINATLTKDGSNTPTADLPMNAQKHTGVGNADARNQYAAVGQVQDGSFTFVAASGVAGTADAITLAPSPTFTAYTAGMRLAFVAEATNTGAVTVNVSSLGAKALQALGSALVGGEIATGDLIEIVYDGTQFQMVSPTIGAHKANTFSASNTFVGTQVISSTGATPILIIRRPEIHGDNKDVAILRGNGQDDLGAAQTYGEYQVVAKSDANGAANGQLLFRTTWGGTAAARFKINEGLFSSNATGGDQGADTINVSEYYRDGALLPFRNSYESPEQTITAAGSLTLAHGLGVEPTLITATLICKTAINNYSVGDQVPIPLGAAFQTNEGVSVTDFDATNITLRYGSATFTMRVHDKNTGATSNTTNANWRLVIRAWA